MTFTTISPIEYLTVSRFYFEFNNRTQLLIAKVSGLSIAIDVAGEGSPIGIGKNIITETQFTPAGVSYQNMTLEFVSTGVNDILLQWYLACHPKASGGGGTAQMRNRFEASLVFYKQNAQEGARWNVRDAIPAKYTTTQVSTESSDLFKETVEVAHAGLIRVPTMGTKLA
jgi:phage tail-like protein